MIASYKKSVISGTFQFPEAGHWEHIAARWKAAFVFQSIFINLSSMEDFYPPTGLSSSSCPVASVFLKKNIFMLV